MDVHEMYQRTLKECLKHKERMSSAFGKIEYQLPLDAHKYTNLTEDEVEHIDQYLFRFAKLQDAMGQRLFEVTLLMLDENIEGMAFVDILNRLEKLGRIPSAEAWRQLRKIRNQVAHEYDDDPEFMAVALNAAFKARTVLVDMLQTVRNTNG